MWSHLILLPFSAYVTFLPYFPRDLNILVMHFLFLLISEALYFNVFYKYLSNKKLLRILPCQKFHLS